MNVAVIILNWNGRNDTLECLKSLQDTGNIIVVDNGSQDDSVTAIRGQFPSVTLLETGKNLGYAGGNNIGIEYAFKTGADAVLLLNNDTIVHPHFVQSFIDSAAQNPAIGIWGGYPLRFSDPEKLDHLGGIWNSEKGDFDLVGLNAPDGFHSSQSLDYVCGCSIFIRREVFDKIGHLEPKFFLFWEEADFAMRAKRAGFGIDICYSAILRHKVSASFTGGKPHKKYFWWRGRALWIERNCSPAEKQLLFKNLIYPELLHYKKLFWLSKLQISLSKLLRKKNLLQKQAQLKEYRAILQALSDYFSKTFHSGPDWLFK